MASGAGRLSRAAHLGQSLEGLDRHGRLAPMGAAWAHAPRVRLPRAATGSSSAEIYGDRRSQIEATYRTHWVSPTLSGAKTRLAEAQARAADLVVISPLKRGTARNAAASVIFCSWRTAARCASSARISTNLSSWPPATLPLPAARRRRAGLLRSWCASVDRGAATNVKGFSSKRRHSPWRRRPAWPTTKHQKSAALRQVEHRSIEDDAFRLSGPGDHSPFPGLSAKRAEVIAAHAGARRSGRIGRSAAGRALDPDAVTFAVVASVRHSDTDYDQLLMSGIPRADARDRVRSDIQDVLDTWRTPERRR